jgi:hypothetical protein
VVAISNAVCKRCGSVPQYQYPGAVEAVEFVDSAPPVLDVRCSCGSWIKVSSADIFELIEQFMAQQSRRGKS